MTTGHVVYHTTVTDSKCSLCLVRKVNTANGRAPAHMLQVANGQICANCAGDIIDALPAFARVSFIVTDSIVENAPAMLESVDIIYDTLWKLRP